MGAIFLTTTDANKLQDTRDTASELRRVQDSMPGRRQGDVAAKLTAYDSATGYYSWTEQAWDEDGVRYDKPSGLSGTHTFMPAISLASAGNATIATFPAQVWLRPVIIAGPLGQVWEILGSTVEVELPEKICITQHSGVVTNITVQKATYQLMGRRLDDTETCEADTGCCPVVVNCGGASYSIPRTLNLHAECLGGISYSFDVTMEYAETGVFGAGWYGTYNPNGTPTPCQVFFIGCDHDTPPTYDELVLIAFDGVGGGTVYKQELSSVATNPFVATGSTFLEYGGGPTCANLPIDCASVSVTITEGSSPPPSGSCCDDGVDLTGVLNADGDDFETFGFSDLWDYDPSAYQAAVDDPRVQWRSIVYDGMTEYYFYFGCLDGQYWIAVPLPLGACFNGMSGYEENELYAFIPVAVNACDDPEVADITLTGNGSGGCAGTLRFTIYR